MPQQNEPHPFVETDHFWCDANFFVVLREMARMFVNGTEWNKKARIVLEYDPQEPRMYITTFMEDGESTPLEAREDFLDLDPGERCNCQRDRSRCALGAPATVRLLAAEETTRDDPASMQRPAVEAQYPHD